MAATDGPVTWKDDASRERYYTLLRAQRADGWRQLADAGRPLPVERDVATTAGPTRAFHWRGSGAPLVLVHGAQTNSIMWAPLIAALCESSQSHLK